MNVMQALEWAFASDWGTDWTKDCQAMVELAEEVKRIHAANIDLTERVLYAERERDEAKADATRKGAKPSDSDVCEWVQVSPSGIKQLHWWGACGMSGLYVGGPSGTCLCGGKIKVKEAK